MCGMHCHRVIFQIMLPEHGGRQLLMNYYSEMVVHGVCAHQEAVLEKSNKRIV